MAKSKAVSYKRTTTTALKAVGVLDIEEDGILLGTDDGDMKKLSALLADFQGAAIQLSVTIKDIDDLPDPSER